MSPRIISIEQRIAALLDYRCIILISLPRSGHYTVIWDRKMGAVMAVLCDESGLTEFPFSYLAHVTLLIPAQVRLRICSSLLRLAQPKNHFRKAAPQHTQLLSETRHTGFLVELIGLQLLDCFSCCFALWLRHSASFIHFVSGGTLARSVANITNLLF